MLTDIAIFLGAAVLAVPLFKRLGLGSVLGYLAAGVLIGPSTLGLIWNVDSVMQLAQFGIVLLLFLIGLDLQPSRLWAMRRRVFGLGFAQVVSTGGALGAALWVFGLEWKIALLAGVALSLSATPFVLKILEERRELASEHGRASVAVLLFQDLAAIPVLALIPLLAVGGDARSEGGSAWVAVGAATGVIVAIVLAGRFVLRPALRMIAATRDHDLSVATALLVVVGTSIAMLQVGLSAALGAFLAGVLLADSEYRHELEASIEPFKGLLLGLFFMAVGMSANVLLVVQEPLWMLGGALGLSLVKAAALAALGRAFGLQGGAALSLGLLLSQGGEFGFVIFTVAREQGVFDPALADRLVMVVTLSMVLTPLLLIARDRIAARRGAAASRPAFDEIPDEGSRVIIAGYGRFGQIVSRILSLKKIRHTALEIDPGQIDFVRKFGNKIYYGDASRIDLLRAAGAERAQVFVLAIDDMEASVRTARVVTENFPHLRIVARARNRQHAYALFALGIQDVFRESFYSSAEAGRVALEALGLDRERVREDVDRFVAYDEQRVRQMAVHRDDEKAQIEGAKSYWRELESIFEADEVRAPLADGK